MINITIPLRIFVLKCLCDGEHNGYGLMTHISSEFGWKPSPGSVYPLLKSMQKEGLIELTGEKNKKIYRITAKGKETYREVKRHHQEIAETMQRHLRTMSSLMGMKDVFLKRIMYNVRNGEFPFKELNPEFIKVREALLGAHKKGKIKKIKEILNETERKLRMIK